MRFAAIAILVAITGFAVHAAEPQEGKDYTVIQSAAAADKSAKIVVTEFFSYQCGHCFAFFKPLRAWTANVPADVQFERVPLSLGHAPWVDIARSFYALQSMDKLEALDADIFNAIHQNGVRLDNSGLIMGWLSKRNIGIIEFDAVYRSAPVREAHQRGEQLAAQKKVSTIPMMMIDGRYLVSIASNVPYEDQLAVVDKLIERARGERKK